MASFPGSALLYLFGVFTSHFDFIHQSHIYLLAFWVTVVNQEVNLGGGGGGGGGEGGDIAVTHLATT